MQLCLIALEKQAWEPSVLSHVRLIHSYLKFCKNCENVSTLPASGTMMLIIIPDVSTDVLLTFINGPNGLNSVT